MERNASPGHASSDNASSDNASLGHASLGHASPGHVSSDNASSDNAPSDNASLGHASPDNASSRMTRVLLVPDLPLERWPSMDRYAHRLHDWLEGGDPGFEVRLAASIGDLTRDVGNGRSSGEI